MKTIILLALLGTAQAQTLEVTNGSMTIQAFNDSSEAFTFAGSDFSLSGGFSGNPLGYEVAPGGFVSNMSGDTASQTLGVNLTVNGVPWVIPQGPEAGGAALWFSPGPAITGAGTYSGDFTLTGGYEGEPLGSNQQSGLTFTGQGTVTITALPYVTGNGGYQVTQETFTFEPSDPPLVQADAVALTEPGTLALFVFTLLFLRRKPAKPGQTAPCQAERRPQDYSLSLLGR
jgi:hypothetical protein